MTAEAAASPRKPRADSVRNREILIAAAKAGFGETGPEVSLEEIARRAGVGIGTLYRHFPTREALIGAVYQREVEQLCDAADELLASHPAAEAMHRWMRLFVSYIGTKKLMAAAIGPSGQSELYALAGNRIMAAVNLMADRARAAGVIRPEIETNDLVRGLIGITYGNTDPDWQASALRLVDIFMAGLRPPAPS